MLYAAAYPSQPCRGGSAADNCALGLQLDPIEKSIRDLWASVDALRNIARNDCRRVVAWAGELRYANGST